jgi:hypothetical protein
MNRPKQSLDEALAGLGTERQPARDLWPAIALGIAHSGNDFHASDGAARVTPATARRPLALVAGVAMLGLAASLAFNFRSLPLPTADTVAGAGTSGTGLAGGAATPIAARFAPPDDAHYLAARAELEKTFKDNLGLLAPATRTRIETDLAAIRAANADIRAALEKDPASPLLLQLMHSTAQQEIDLYKNVARATTPMSNPRTRT